MAERRQGIWQGLGCLSQGICLGLWGWAATPRSTKHAKHDKAGTPGCHPGGHPGPPAQTTQGTQASSSRSEPGSPPSTPGCQGQAHPNPTLEGPSSTCCETMPRVPGIVVCCEEKKTCFNCHVEFANSNCLLGELPKQAPAAALTAAAAGAQSPTQPTNPTRPGSSSSSSPQDPPSPRVGILANKRDLAIFGRLWPALCPAKGPSPGTCRECQSNHSDCGGLASKYSCCRKRTQQGEGCRNEALYDRPVAGSIGPAASSTSSSSHCPFTAHEEDSPARGHPSSACGRERKTGCCLHWQVDRDSGQTRRAEQDPGSVKPGTTCTAVQNDQHSRSARRCTAKASQPCTSTNHPCPTPSHPSRFASPTSSSTQGCNSCSRGQAHGPAWDGGEQRPYKGHLHRFPWTFWLHTQRTTWENMDAEEEEEEEEDAEEFGDQHREIEPLDSLASSPGHSCRGRSNEPQQANRGRGRRRCRERGGSQATSSKNTQGQESHWEADPCNMNAFSPPYHPQYKIHSARWISGRRHRPARSTMHACKQHLQVNSRKKLLASNIKSRPKPLPHLQAQGSVREVLSGILQSCTRCLPHNLAPSRLEARETYLGCLDIIPSGNRRSFDCLSVLWGEGI